MFDGSLPAASRWLLPSLAARTANLPAQVDESRVRSIVEEYLAERTPGLMSPASAMELAPDTAELDGGGMEVGKDLSMSAAWNNGLELSDAGQGVSRARWRAVAARRFLVRRRSGRAEQSAGRRHVSRRRRFPPGTPAHRRHDV